LQLSLEAAVLDRDRGLLGKGLHQGDGGLAEQRASLGVGHGQGAEDGVAHGQGDEHRRPNLGSDDRLDHPLIGRGVGQHHRLAGADDLPGHRALGRERRPPQLVGQQAIGRLDRQSASTRRPGKGGQVGTGQFPGVAHHQRQQLLGVGPGQDGGGDGPDRLQPLGAVTGLLVQLGVLDGHPSLGSEQDKSPLVVGVEVLPTLLLGQIQVAVDPATRGDWSAEEGVHWRVVGWEPDRAGVLGDVAQPQGPGVVDQHPEDAAADRDVSDGRPLLLGHPGGDELADGPVATQHPQRPVPGPGELGGQLDDALQGGRERQLGGERKPGFQQALVLRMGACHRRQRTPPAVQPALAATADARYLSRLARSSVRNWR
jgi:hypothetical protein